MRRATPILLLFILFLFPGLVRAVVQPSLSGRVVDEETRRSIADVEVEAVLGTSALRTVTDKDGRYTVRDLKPGTYQIRLGSPLMESVAAVKPQLEVTVPQGKAVIVPDFRFPRGGTVSGIVLSERKGVRSPQWSATVDLALADPQPAWGLRSGSATTNYKGTFAFRRLPAAKKCVVTVRVEGHTDLQRTVSLMPGKSVEGLTFVFPWDGQAGIMGAVKDTVTGQMLPGVMILVKNKAGDVAGRTETDRSGEFSLVGLAPGSYTAEAVWGGTNRLSQPVVVERERTTTVIFEYGAAKP